MKMICPYCNQEARFVDNAEIYGKRYGKSYMMYWCQPCDSLVGTHQNDPKRPLGTMANKELRNWRRKAHAAIDPIWKEGPMSRARVYEILSNDLGKQVHVGESDIDMCKKIIEVAIKNFTPDKSI